MLDYLSNFLFTTPSFFKGMASSMDIGSTLTRYNESVDEIAADNTALSLDWYIVGKDLRDAMTNYDK